MNINLKVIIDNIIKKSKNNNLIIKNEDTDSIQSIYNSINSRNKLFYLGNGTQVISFSDYNYEYVYKFCYKDNSTIFNNKVKYSDYETILININNALEKENLNNEEKLNNNESFIKLLLSEEIFLNNNKWFIYKQSYCKTLKYCSYTILYYILELLKVSIQNGYVFSDIYYKNFGYTISDKKYFISLYDYHNIDEVNNDTKTGFLILNLYLNICSAMNISTNKINTTELLIKHSYGKGIIDNIYVDFLKKLHKGFKYIKIDDFTKLQSYIKDKYDSISLYNEYKFIKDNIFLNINNLFNIFNNELLIDELSISIILFIIKHVSNYIKPLSTKIQSNLIFTKNKVLDSLIMYYLIYDNIDKEFSLDKELYNTYSLLSLPNVNNCTYIYPQLYIGNTPNKNYYWNIIISINNNLHISKSEFIKYLKITINININSNPNININPNNENINIYLLCKK